MPRHNHHSNNGSTPEDRFDHWLDAFATGTPGHEGSRNDARGELARAQAGARQLHDLAARTSMPGRPVRQRIKEDLMQQGVFATPNNGTTWIPSRDREPAVPWWSPRSPVIAGVLIFALILALAGSLIWTQRPALSPNSANAPGFAVASPGTTPTNETLACGASGYRAVIASTTDLSALDAATFGMESILIGDNEVTASLSNGTTVSIPKDRYATVDPGVVVTLNDDGSSTITRLSDGRNWETPAVDGNSSIARGNGRYYLAPTNEAHTNWLVLDILTGDQTTTADILGEPFAIPLTPALGGERSSSDDLNIYVVDFAQSPSPLSVAAGTPEPTAVNPGVLVVPGSLSEAYFKVLSPHTKVSPDGGFLASYNEILDASTGKPLETEHFPGTIEGIFVAFIDDAPTILTFSGSELRLIRPSHESNEVLYVADGQIETVAFDQATHTAVIGVGASGSESWTWLNLDTRETIAQSELGGYQLNRTSPTEPSRLVNDVAAFTRPSDDALVSVRGLDMQSGQVSTATIHRELPDGDGFFILERDFTYGDLIATFTPTGGTAFTSTELTNPIDLGSPDGVDLFDDSLWRLDVAPNGACAYLTNYSDDSAPTFVAPIVSGAEWKQLDVRLSHWVETLNTDEARTLPAPEFSTPVATPATTPVATPEATSRPESVVVVEGESEHARIEGDIAIATLNEEGLTLPITDGETATIPNVTGFAWSMTIYEGQLLVYRESQSPAVLDIDTGELVLELSEFQNFGREYGYGRWYMAPIDEELTDWTIVDIVTGETRLLSDVVDLPGNTVMPFPAFDSPGWDAEVFEVLEGAADGFNFEPGPRPVSTFAIGGSLDRMTEVADYPATLDRTGTPAMVAGDEGRFIAYETRAADDRIVIVDLESGEELARYGVDDVGDDPTLGGFTEDAQTLVITTGDRVMMLASQGDSAEIVREGLENSSNPLFYPGEAALYFTQGDRVMRLDIPDGELTEIASGFVPGGFSFTKPGGSDWLFFQTRAGVTLVNAASGEIISQMKLPGATGGFPEADAFYFWADADGDTMIIGMERQGIDSNGVPGTVWLLSPEFPNGLEIRGPSDEHPIGNVFLSPDGTTLYASTREHLSGPSELWMTPLGDEPTWELIAEDLTVRTFFPFDGAP